MFFSGTMFSRIVTDPDLLTNITRLLKVGKVNFLFTPIV